MKNTVKLLGTRPLVCIALAALIGFTMMACPTDPPESNSTSITWTLGQTGGVPGESGGAATASTTAITITFSASVSLMDADITIGGAAARNSSENLSSAGKVWTVPVTVSDTDNATVTVTKNGVKGGTKNVMVYKEDKTAPSIYWTAQTDGTSGTVSSTKITFTFTGGGGGVIGLEADDITITDGTGAASKGDLTGSGTTWELEITVQSAGTISVQIDKDGISATAQDVTVHKAGEATPTDITWTAEADGEAGITTSTMITLSFSADVEELGDDDITLTGGTGSASISYLAEDYLGDQTTWTLYITVETEGNVSVSISKAGISATAQNVAVYKAVAPITWTAEANGTANSVDSTKITFTFSEAVTGLTVNNITLANRNGSATKSVAPSGSGTTWDLTISAVKQGGITVKITKDGVSPAAQSVVVHKSGGAPTNPVSGVTTWLYDTNAYSGTLIVFSDSNNGSGTYKQNGFDWNSNEWEQLTGEGTWDWNQSTQTATLTTTKVTDIYSGEMLDKTEWETACREQVETDTESELEYYTNEDWGMGMSEQEAEEFFLEYYNGQNGTSYTTINEYIEGETARKVGDVFAPRSYAYIYSSDGESLILLEALPEADGTDELAGKTFYGSTPDWAGGYEKDESQTYIFSNTGNTFTATLSDWSGAISVTGSYSYDSTAKQVYLKPDTINSQSPAQFYEAAEVNDWSSYPTEADDRTMQTSQKFMLMKYGYDSDDEVLFAGGGISGFSSTKGSVRQRSR